MRLRRVDSISLSRAARASPSYDSFALLRHIFALTSFLRFRVEMEAFDHTGDCVQIDAIEVLHARETCLSITCIVFWPEPVGYDVVW